MSEYHKIESLFKRELTGDRQILEGQYTNQYFEYLADTVWEWTEKVDGTNIRIMVSPEGEVTFGGRTDNAQIPAFLVTRLQEIFLSQADALKAMFPEGAALYGEGYGAKIQKVGALYRPNQDFVLFDVKIGQWWLKRGAVNQIAETLNIESVPLMGHGTLEELTQFVKKGFNSFWGDFTAEGIVARPVVEIRTRSNNRIITKLKHKDFIENKERKNSNGKSTDQKSDPMENGIINPGAPAGADACLL